MLDFQPWTRWGDYMCNLKKNHNTTLNLVFKVYKKQKCLKSSEVEKHADVKYRSQ